MYNSKFKKIATYSREDIISRIKLSALEIGISKDNVESYNSNDEKYFKLIKRLKDIGYNSLIEEAAYTWFNRFVAIYFMEMNDFFPDSISILTGILKQHDNKPYVVFNPFDSIADIDNIVMTKLSNENNEESILKYIIISLCNLLHSDLSFLFNKDDDYLDLLFPKNLLNNKSFLYKFYEIDEKEWFNVEIIGWLYQFYISEKKFSITSEKREYETNEVSIVTQLFTPKWIVKYMVENSLGKFWCEINKNSEIKNTLKYLIESPQQKKVIEDELKNINYTHINPEEITFFDPCCGSGNILVYAFDIFYKIYLECGYTKKEIPKLIIEKNLFGLDIDKRAVQFANFALIMKAREVDKKIFNQNINSNIFFIENYDFKNLSDKEIENTFFDLFKNADVLGSSIKIDFIEKNKLDILMEKTNSEKLKKIMKILSSKYDVVVTNPPYMGSRNMPKVLKAYLKNFFPDSKNDLFSVFIEQSLSFLKENGYCSLITPPSWLFLSSYKNLRYKIISNFYIDSLLHMGRGIFGIDWGSSAFVLRKTKLDYTGAYFRLHKRNFQHILFSDIERLFIHSKNNKNYKFDFDSYIENFEDFSLFKNKNSYKISFEFVMSDFLNIPDYCLAYWINENYKNIFKKYNKLSFYASPRQGLATGNNKKFLRYWFEVSKEKIGNDFNNIEDFHNSNKLYAPYNKGGNFKKWYGNNELVIKFDKKHFSMLKNSGNKLPSKKFYFHESITWSLISSTKFGIRYSPNGFVFDVIGSSIFANSEMLFYLMGLLSSKVTVEFLKILNPTLAFQVGDIKNIPVIIDDKKDYIISIVKENISISKNNWDMFEISPDFKSHPFLLFKDDTNLLENSYNNWQNFCEKEFEKLKQNEEKINDFFIKLYGLENDIDHSVNDTDLTFIHANKKRDVKSFLSYIVGCIFGRYSLKDNKVIVQNNIIPNIKEDIFEDDNIKKVIEMIKYIFGENSLKENLKFISNELNGDIRTPELTIKNYFLKDFFTDHYKYYKQRPVYWMFSSSNSSFKALFYIHNYSPDDLIILKNNYLIYFKEKIESLLRIQYKNDNIKEINYYEKILKEIQDYITIIDNHIEKSLKINLDDGVEVNYEKFKSIVL